MFLLGPHGLANVEGKIGVVGVAPSRQAPALPPNLATLRSSTTHVHAHVHVHVHVHVYGIFTDTTGRAAERFSNQDTKMVVSKVVSSASWRETVSPLFNQVSSLVLRKLGHRSCL